MAWKPLDTPTDDELTAFKARLRGKPKFLVDESAGPELSRVLSEEAGYNSRSVHELQLCGHSDEDVFSAAWSEGRVIITHDADFLDDRRFPPHRNAGVVVIRPGADGKDDNGLLTCLAKLLLMAGDIAAWFRGKKIEFTSDETIIIASNDGGGKTRDRFKWPERGPISLWVDD